MATGDQGPNSTINSSTGDLEKRVDESTGKLLTKEEFKFTYGGDVQWNKAMTMAQMRGEEKNADEVSKTETTSVEEKNESDESLIEAAEAMLLETAELEQVRNELRKMDLVKYLKKMIAETVETVRDLKLETF